MKFSPRCSALITVVFDGRTFDPNDNSPPQHFITVPREGSVTYNGYHEADTWTLDFDARILPFDPDSIASCNVRIFMWDNEDGYVGARENELARIAQLDNFGPILDKRLGRFEMIRGITDEDRGVFVGEDNTIKLTGVDYTGLLTTKEWDPRVSVPSGQPLDETVQQIADEAAPANSAARFRVVWLAQDSDPPITGHVHRDTKKKGMQVKPGKNYWDVIYDLVIQHGFIVYVRNSDIVITDPVTQTAESLGDAPRLVYGKNLDALEVKRKFGREKVPQVVLRAYDPESGQQIEVVYPDKTNVIVDGLAVKKNEQMFFPAPKGVIDREALMRYARIRYYHLGRAETEYEIGTKDLSIVAPGGDRVDMLKFRNGGAVGIVFDPFHRSGWLRAQSVERRATYIKSLGYSTQVAQFAALNIDKITQYQQPYYMRNGRYDWSVENGIDIEWTCCNFASEIREATRAEGAWRTLRGDSLDVLDRQDVGGGGS